jgi:c-di-GMP-binding flagellar brake protein YcgR
MLSKPGYMKQTWPTSRQFPRHALEARVRVGEGSAAVRGWCCDISEGGLACILPTKLEIGQEVELNFYLPPLKDPLSIRAVMRYSSGFRYGFEYLAISPQQREAITTYCKRTPEMKT